jgi:hypothetical protein
MGAYMRFILASLLALLALAGNAAAGDCIDPGEVPFTSPEDLEEFL